MSRRIVGYVNGKPMWADLGPARGRITAPSEAHAQRGYALMAGSVVSDLEIREDERRKQQEAEASRRYRERRRPAA